MCVIKSKFCIASCKIGFLWFQDLGVCIILTTPSIYILMMEASLKTWQRFALLYIALYIFNEIIFIAIALHSSQCACSKEKQARLLAFAVLAIILNP